MSDSSQPHGLQHARLPCPSPSPEVCPNSCPLHYWCHPTNQGDSGWDGWMAHHTNQPGSSGQDLALICRSDPRSMSLSSCSDKWLPKACSFHSNSHEYLNPSFYLHHICLICHWSQREIGTHTLLSMRPMQAKDQTQHHLGGGAYSSTEVWWRE